MEPFLGQIVMFAGNYAPRGWAYCNGQLYPISQNQALFSILNTTYGGDGRTTFAVPDFRGRVPMSAGAAPGLPVYKLGAKAGKTTETLTTNQMPSHTHFPTSGTLPITGEAVASMKISDANNDAGEIGAGAYLGRNSGGPLYSSTTNQTLNEAAISVETDGLLVNTSNIVLSHAGASTPVSVMQPYQVVHFIICVNGLYPSRS